MKITHIEFSGIDHNDFPNYCDAYISAAQHDDADGSPVSEIELEQINNDREFVSDQLANYLIQNQHA